VFLLESIIQNTINSHRKNAPQPYPAFPQNPRCVTAFQHLPAFPKSTVAATHPTEFVPNLADKFHSEQIDAHSTTANPSVTCITHASPD
jgi:hypothetical protein